MQSFNSYIPIHHFLPHRVPMLMVDWIVELTSQEVKTIFEIKDDNVFIENDLFSEVGLIENAAQTCSSIVGQTFFVDDNQNIKEGVEVVGFISGIKKAKVYNLPKVGATISTMAILHSRFDADNYSICTIFSKTYNAEELIFEAEINLFIQEKQ